MTPTEAERCETVGGAQLQASMQHRGCRWVRTLLVVEGARSTAQSCKASKTSELRAWLSVAPMRKNGSELCAHAARPHVCGSALPRTVHEIR